jgi:hypothetical protein
MTFCPEWLSGSPNLDTSNFMYMYVFPRHWLVNLVLTMFRWVYLVFFNMLWVFIPFWILYETYCSMTGASPLGDAVAAVQKKTK